MHLVGDRPSGATPRAHPLVRAAIAANRALGRDAELAAAEVRRNAERGCFAVTFSENPHPLGLPSVHDEARFWDPFFAACEETGTSVNMHIGSSSQLVITADDAPIDVLISLQPVNIVQAAADLLWSPVLRKFPTLKVSLSEGGIGWIPYFLERMDGTFRKHRFWTHSIIKEPPSTYWFRQGHATFIEDHPGVKLRHEAGLENILWSSDYPHSDSTWPRSREVVAEQFGKAALEAVSCGLPVLASATGNLARLAEAFVPILFVTGDHSPAVRLASLEAGADGYLLRPFATGELLAGGLARHTAVALRPEVRLVEDEARHALEGSTPMPATSRTGQGAPEQRQRPATRSTGACRPSGSSGGNGSA